MSTTYDERPAFEHRVTGASLIVVGTIGSIVHAEQEYATVEVAVEKTIKGKAPADRIRVRVVIDANEKTHGLAAGQNMVLLLAPDYGPDRPQHQFVQYFSTSYSMDGDYVRIDPLTAKELAVLNPAAGKERVALDDFAGIVRAIVREGAAEQARLDAALPPEHRWVASIQESPQPVEAGPHNTTPGPAVYQAANLGTHSCDPTSL